MKLNEIIKDPNQTIESGIKNDNINFSSEKEVTIVDNKKIYEYKIKNSNFIMFAMKDDNEEKIIAYIIGILSVPHFNIARTFTNSKFRGKGYMTAIYRAIFVNLGYALVSDKSLSPESRSIWKKINKLFHNKVKILDTTDNKEFPFTDDENSEFYNDEKYRFILESKSMHESYINHPSVLPQYIYYLSGEARSYYKKEDIKLL